MNDKVWESRGRRGRKEPIHSTEPRKECKVCKQKVKPLSDGKLPIHANPLNKKGKWAWCKGQAK